MRSGLVLALAVGVVLPLSAQRPLAPDSATVAAGPRYDRSFAHRLIFGTRYRDLWNTVIEVPVLDLDTFGGGLTPLSQGGFGQTVTLAFDSREGTGFLFRSVDKRRAQGLDEQFRGTVVEQVVQDQTSSQLPGGALVVSPLLAAAGLLHTTPTLVVLPDDARLGPFRAEFAGMLGTIEELAREGPGGEAGFGGSTRILPTEEFLERLDASDRNRLDAREFLAARLIDLLVGDRDRHAGQWRWARFPDGDRFVWRPIALDRDEAFIALDGIAMSMVRSRLPKLVSFERAYPSIHGLTWNAWDLDRRLLVELDRAAWDSITTSIQRRLTDDVIARAVRQLPPPLYEQIGDDLTDALIARRNALPEAVDEFYGLVTRYVDVHATEVHDVASVEFGEDEAVTITLRRAAASAPYYRRRFLREETEEIRLYLGGGDDHLVVRGRGDKHVRVRIVGGGGNDVLADSSATRGGRIWFYDGEGQNTFRVTSATHVDGRSYDRPLSNEPFHQFALDWGDRSKSASRIGWNSDHGVIVLPGLQWTHYEFRKHPYRSRQTVNLGLSSSGRFVGEYENHIPGVLSDVDASIRLRVSGADKSRFYGFGNETPDRAKREARVWQYDYELASSLAIALPARTTFEIGPTFKILDTQRRIGTVLDSIRPYGEGFFGHAAMRARLEIDGREHPLAPRSGFHFEARGELAPPLFDARDAFGSLSATLAGYVTVLPGRGITLAARIGAERSIGDAPFHAKAYLGGERTVRGYTAERFVGDASVYANTEIRFPLGTVFVLAPIEVGGFLLADVGRVFLEGETSSVWHGTGGAGLTLAPFGRDYLAMFYVARGETLRIRSGLGFMF